MEGTNLNIIKDKYKKSTANILLKREKRKTFPLNSGSSQEFYFFPFYVLNILVEAIRQESKYLYLSMLWFYVWDPKDDTRKHLVLINIFSKMISYKINT